MNWFSSKLLPTTAAIAALSATSVLISEPAQAAVIDSRSTSFITQSGSNFSTQIIDFSGLPNGNLSASTNLGNGITLSRSGGQTAVSGSGASKYLQTPDNGDPVLTFNFGTTNPLAYFGVLLRSGSALNGTITLKDIGGSNVYTKTFSNVAGSGNYFNFSAPLVSQRIATVEIAGKNIQLDDIAYRVPTPALLPGLVGMGVAALRKRQAEKSEQEAC